MKKVITLARDRRAALASGGAGLAAQGGRRGAARGRRGRHPAVTPAEIQRMFDAYALMQAQEQLKIATISFRQFLTRYKALQDVPAVRNLQERARLINEMLAC